ncbi:MAG: ADP-ribosylglycohydrolase family protein [Gammaproteobacteria bacterium]
MRGAIIGDIIGSVYEFKNPPMKQKDFELFADNFYTDDSVCTAAVADILLNGGEPAQVMQKWCRRHPRRGYGGMFREWIDMENPAPYESYGNGAAMRVSPAAFLNSGDLTAALKVAGRVTKITHNHEEGVRGAEAATHAIWLALNGENPKSIRDTVAGAYHYDLSQTVDEIRPDYEFDETCQGTVPQAIICALKSKSYEDAVRNAVSLGGDADTLAAIAGPIAEAMHGIPENIKQRAEKYLRDAPDINEVMEKMYKKAGA